MPRRKTTWTRRTGPGLMLGLALTAAGSAAGPQEIGDAVIARRPQIEEHAPEAFGGRPPARRHASRYQVNATVLIPFFGIPIADRDDVGFATVVVEEFDGARRPELRTVELFAASFPERARGLNRIGFIREAIGLGPAGPTFTAHFGALSSNPETSRDEVELDADESMRAYTVLDGLTDGHGSSNRDVRLELDGSWASAGGFYRRLVPVWRHTPAEPEVRSEPQTVVRHMQPLGFLGIVGRSLEVAASDVARDATPRRIRYPFAHKGELMYLHVGGHRVDDRRGRRLAAAGFLDEGAILHRLDYRVLDDDGGHVQSFRVWTELAGRAERGATPIVPVSFVFNAKPFLRLEAVRTSVSAD